MKKVIAMLLVCCMLLGGLTACAPNPNQPDGPGEQTSSQNGKDGNKVVSADGKITAEANTYDNLSDYEAYLGKELTFSEAPMLAEKVKAGELPAVEERLPENPLVMMPLSDEKSVGVYGGELRVDNMVGLGTMDYPLRVTTASMIEAETGYSENVYCSILESFEISEDSKEYTFHIRKGLKWSDGVPVTTDDVDFWWNDLCQNEDALQTAWITAESVEIIDKYTYKYIFSEPFNIYDNLAGVVAEPFFYPKHHCSKFHPDYASEDEINKMVEEQELSHWSLLVETNSCVNWGSYKIGAPTLTPYVCVEKTETQAVLERNPYYMAVDATGQQLPYIDRIVTDLTVADSEVARLRVLQGDSDFYKETGMNFASVAIAEGKESGKVNTAFWTSDKTNQTTVNVNVTTKNAALKELFQNKDFRFALSYAINRQEIIDLNYYGLLEPKQASWSKNSKYYNEAANNVALEYDPEQANEILDNLGLNKRDADGWRLLKNGDRLELNMVYPITDAFNVKDGELIMEYFRDVGIYTTLKGYETAVFGAMRDNSEYDIAVAYSWGINEGCYTGCGDLVPHANGWWAPDWCLWYSTDGAEGEKPVAEALEALAAYDAYCVAATEEERAVQMKKITDIYAENLWVIGVCDYAGYTVVFNSNLKNVPTMKADYTHADDGRVQCWYFAE